MATDAILGPSRPGPQHPGSGTDSGLRQTDCHAGFVLLPAHRERLCRFVGSIAGAVEKLEGTMSDDLKHLRETILLAKQSRDTGNHPFGALLVGPDGAVLLRSGNTWLADKGVGHAEANVARAASQSFSAAFLAGCTLYTSVEPCCMCAGACYWAGIGTVVYGMTEKRLAVLTGDNPDNLTLDLPCETVFAAGQRRVDTRGPFVEIETEVAAGHAEFW